MSRARQGVIHAIVLGRRQSVMQIARFRSLRRRGMRLAGVTHASDGPGEPLSGGARERLPSGTHGGAGVGGRVAGKRGAKGSTAAISGDPRYWHLAVPASMTSASPEAETLAALRS